MDIDRRASLTLAGRSKPYILAHRGSQALYPENTLISFEQALEDGADAIETDLHLSKDGEFVCIHDPTLDRTSDGTGNVADLTLAELKNYNFSARFPDIEPQQILTLAEIAGVIPADRGLVLELKSERFLERDVCIRLARELERYGIRQRTLLISFNIGFLEAAQATAPDLPIGLISLSNPIPPRGVQFCGPLWVWVILNPFYIHQAHKRGQMVCPLDPESDRRLGIYQHLGCDAILTNNPAQTCRLLHR